MTNIREWLEGLGLDRHADAFEAQEIDLEALPEITDEDLKDMGLPIGPRRKIAKAIRELDSEPQATAATALPANAPLRSSGEADRRQLTVMFCDLVGSTALSEQLDPEDLRALMASYQTACGAVVERYDGHVAQYLGDGLMVYFGWPRAHEDDAQRAVRAGLEIVAAVKRVAARETLQVRIGVATGSVVVGETGAGDAAVPKAAVGETPNIAARIQALAGADELLIAATTRRLAGGAFEYQELGEQNLKGVVEPLRVSRVLGASQAEGRFGAQAVGGLTPLVGRETETQLLLERWQQAKEGEGRVVLLSGEAGIGKSRVTEVLCEHIAGEKHVRLRYQCSPYYNNSAFYPAIAQLERAAGFARDDSTEQKLDKLEATLAMATADPSVVAPLFAAMLSLPVDRYPPLELSPPQQKQKTIEALTEHVLDLAAKNPVLMIFEDAHWMDPTTLETLSALIERIDSAPVLIVITHRPEFDPPWTGNDHVEVHSLSRLSRRMGADLVAKVVGDKALPDEVLDQIVAKTDGVPLFVEELTKMVLEAGFLKDAGDRYELEGPLPPLAIPTTLQDSLMARLDRLATVKEVIQIGAAIGREFSLELLSLVSPLDENELHDALGQLVTSELVFRRGQGAETRYVFKNALVQDVAYDSTLKSERQHLHSRIAKALEDRFQNYVEVAPELLAYHYSKAGLVEQAVDSWLAAGRRAGGRGAFKEAIAHLRTGLEHAKALGDPGLRDQRELDLLLALGTPLIAVNGVSSKSVGELYDRARVLCYALDDDVHLSPVMWGLASHRAFLGELRSTFPLAEQFIDRAEQSNDDTARINANRVMGFFQLATGDFAGSRASFERSLSLYRIDRHRSLAALYGQDARVASLAVLSQVLWFLGYPDQALASAVAARDHAEYLDDEHSIVYAHHYSAGVSTLRGDYETAHGAADRCIEIAQARGFPSWIATTRVIVGEIVAAQGDPVAGLAEAKAGFGLFQQLGARFLVPQLRATLARICTMAGVAAEGLDHVENGLAEAQQTGEQSSDAELMRLRAELTLLQAPERTEDAEADLLVAIRRAGEQAAKSIELRAATDLARLWHRQGNSPAAQALLAPVYGWFTEGTETADLKTAKALLEELVLPTASDSKMTG
jgi:class 3 adenylate cyclase/predicted ATPase